MLWVLLPLAVLFAGVAPAVISFAAGQAAFTLTLLILFNIIQPAGWRIGLVRVEDVALGCAVSLVVGLLFWPRGAGAALRRALADGLRRDRALPGQGGRVRHALLRLRPAGAAARRRRGGRCARSAASRRLDDAFRSYLAERGAKPVPLAERDEPGHRRRRAAPDRRRGAGPVAARRSTRPRATAPRRAPSWCRPAFASTAGTTSWRRVSAIAHGVPVPLARDADADDRFVDAVRHDLLGRRTGTPPRPRCG